MPITKVECAECGKKIRVTNATKLGNVYICKRCAMDKIRGKQFPSEGK